MKWQNHDSNTIQKAWQQAIKLLSYRQRSEWEMLTALQKKGYHEKSIATVLNRLKDNGLLDDSQFAYDWAAYRLSTRPIGSLRLEYELKRRGVSPLLAEEVVMALLTEEAELDTARKLAQQYHRRKKKHSGHYDRRLYHFLQQRGFKATIIHRVLKETRKNDNIDDDELNL